MKRFLPVSLFVAALLLPPLASPVSAVNDEDVDRAIKKLQEALLTSQDKGSWEHLYKNEHAGSDPSRARSC